MGSHPANLVFRFLLETCLLIASGYWGWNQSEGIMRYLLAIGIPLAAALLWGTFAVPNDPTRSGRAPVAVPGILRLALELALFAFAVWSLLDVGETTLGLVFGVSILAHYLISYDRIGWLLRQS